MSEETTGPLGSDAGDELMGAPGGVSLEARIAAKAQEIHQAATERFAIPGKFHDYIAVELRAVGYKEAAKIGLRHERTDQIMRPLYAEADVMVRATVAFWSIQDDGSYAASDGSTWQSLARAANAQLPPDATPRMALLDLCGDDGAGAMLLAQDYGNWLRGGRQVREDEVMRDFAKTA